MLRRGYPRSKSRDPRNRVSGSIFNPRQTSETSEPIYRFDNNTQKSETNTPWPIRSFPFTSTSSSAPNTANHGSCPDIAPELHRYLGGSVKKQDCIPLIIGGTTNHVHMLVRTKSTLAPADLIKEIKRSSSEWLSKKGIACGYFHWQDGYGAFSISYWDVNKIVALHCQSGKTSSAHELGCGIPPIADQAWRAI